MRYMEYYDFSVLKSRRTILIANQWTQDANQYLFLINWSPIRVQDYNPSCGIRQMLFTSLLHLDMPQGCIFGIAFFL